MMNARKSRLSNTLSFQSASAATTTPATTSVATKARLAVSLSEYEATASVASLSVGDYTVASQDCGSLLGITNARLIVRQTVERQLEAMAA
jgi:hypothetical protein